MSSVFRLFSAAVCVVILLSCKDFCLASEESSRTQTVTGIVSKYTGSSLTLKDEPAYYQINSKTEIGDGVGPGQRVTIEFIRYTYRDSNDKRKNRNIASKITLFNNTTEESDPGTVVNDSNASGEDVGSSEDGEPGSGSDADGVEAEKDDSP